MKKHRTPSSSLHRISVVSVLTVAVAWSAPSSGQNTQGGSFRERLSSRAEQRAQQAEQAPTDPAAAQRAGRAAPAAPAPPTAGVQPGRIPHLDPATLHVNFLNDGIVRGGAIHDAIIMACSGERDPMIRENAEIMNRVRTEQFPTVLAEYMQQYDERYEEQLAIRGRAPCAANAVEQAYATYVQRLDWIVQQSATAGAALAAAAVPGRATQAVASTGPQLITTPEGVQLDCMHAGNRDQNQACYRATRQARMSPYINVIGAATTYAAWAEACGDPSGPALKQDAVNRLAVLPEANRAAIVATGEASAQAMTIVIEQMIASYPDACARSLPQYRTGYDQAVELAQRN